MCGIAGFTISPTLAAGPLAEKMRSCLAVRGPNDAGTWFSPRNEIAFVHTRLSILDLSPEGHQPMASRSGRFVITFNGEIFNFTELQTELRSRGHSFRGGSDTEVMLAAFEEWGVENAIEKFVGMFAFVLWDEKNNSVTLVRDRLGIKPLYYGWVKNGFVFASQLSPIQQHPDFDQKINPNAVGLLTRFNYVPTPHSIYEKIFKLPPGTIFTLPISKLKEPPSQFSPFAESTSVGESPRPYWSLQEKAESGERNPFTGTDEEAIQQLDALLNEAIELRMVADVPLGAFLSGGVDSSTVVAIMQRHSTRPVKTFAIGFSEKSFNEAEYAKAVALHLKTDHAELYVSPAEAQAVIPQIPEMYDEPFADSSQIPTFLVSKLARQSVTVSLSGDGGDELFGGYLRYIWALRAHALQSVIPRTARELLLEVAKKVGEKNLDAALSLARKIAPIELPSGDLGGRAMRTFHRFVTPGRELYAGMAEQWGRIGLPVTNSVVTRTTFTDVIKDSKVKDFLQYMTLLDLTTYLPDDILTKVDRASMAVSLEARVPLLDHRLVEFALTLPARLKVRSGKGKWLLRQVLNRYVPGHLVERPKQGFAIPLDSWLRGPLREWAEDLLSEKKLSEGGFFDSKVVRNRWNAHISGRENALYDLWSVLMFQAWYAKRP